MSQERRDKRKMLYRNGFFMPFHSLNGEGNAVVCMVCLGLLIMLFIMFKDKE